MKALGIPWTSKCNDQGNWSVVNSTGQTLITIDYRVATKDAKNLAHFIAAIPDAWAAINRVNKMIGQLVPAARFSGERRKKKFDELEAMEAGIDFVVCKIKTGE